jgi:hypothetical protein
VGHTDVPRRHIVCQIDDSGSSSIVSVQRRASCRDTRFVDLTEQDCHRRHSREAVTPTLGTAKCFECFRICKKRASAWRMKLRIDSYQLY